MLQESESMFVEEVMPEIINNQMYQAISFPSILQMEILKHNDSGVSIVQTFVEHYLEYQEQNRNKLLSTEAREFVRLQNPQLMVKLLAKVRPAILLKLLEYNDFRQEYQQAADISKVRLADNELDDRDEYHKVTLRMTRRQH